MKDNPNDKGSKERSYFAAGRQRRNRNLMVIIPTGMALIGIIVAVTYIGGFSIGSSKMLLHNHVHLNVTLNGLPVEVPAHIGMTRTGFSENPLLYGDHSLDQYGMEGMSPLHTHDASGLIHVESNVVRNYTLGELLDTWKGLDTNNKEVMAIVDNKSVLDFRNMILKDGEKITLDISS